MNEAERTLLIADLSGYTALTETHGAVHASEVVLRSVECARLFSEAPDRYARLWG